MLPSLNGIEVLRRLRQVKQTPVIILTARDQIMDKVAGLDLGANDYMTKPFTVSYGCDAIDLTKKEFVLLVYLLENRNVVISREQALDAVWGFDFYGNTNVVDVYIRYLRSKIDDVYGVKIIQTVRGSGYVIRDV